MADIHNIGQEIRDAAKALTLASIREPTNNEKGKCFNHIWFASFNEALNYLLKTGLTKTLSFVDNELTCAREAHLAFVQIMRFFSDNPGVAVVMPSNFPDGSPARQILYDFMREVELYENAPKGLAIAVAAIEFSNCQRDLERLTAAKNAIQRAIASEHLTAQ